jgi:hypothetical protein
MKRRALPPISSVVGCVRPWREEEHECTVDADGPVVIAQAHKHNAVRGPTTGLNDPSL